MRIGMEALRYFGVKSKLADELTELFQSVIDKKKEFEDKLDNRKVVTEIRKITTSVTFKKQLTDIIKRNTNLNIKPKILTQGITNMFAIGFTVTEHMRDFSGYFDYIRYQSEFPSEKDLQQQLERARKSMDKETGKIKDTEAADVIIGRDAILYFCSDSAFCRSNYHSKAEELTAKGLTSIILHELGHILKILEYASTMYKTAEEFITPTKFTAKNYKDLHKQLQPVKAALEKSQVAKTSKQGTIAKKAIETVEEILEKKTNIMLAETIVCSILIAILAICLFPVTIMIAITVMMQWWIDDFEEIAIYNKKHKVKDSDLKHTQADRMDLEIRADEFVSSFGYSGHLVSALTLLETSAGLGGTGSAPAYKPQWLWKFNFTHALNLAMCGYYALFDVHPPMLERIDNIRRDVLRQLKNDDVPKNVMQNLLIQYRNILNQRTALIEYNKKNNKFYRNYGMVIKNIDTAGGLLKFILTGNGSKEYNDLLHVAKLLSSNELIYNQKRLETM